MKRCLPKLIIPLLLISLLVPFGINAADPCPPGRICIDNPLSANTFTELVNNIISFLFYISFPIGALMISISAFIFLTSGGNPEKVTKAKNLIIWTIVGIIVIWMAGAIDSFLEEIFGASP